MSVPPANEPRPMSTAVLASPTTSLSNDGEQPATRRCFCQAAAQEADVFDMNWFMRYHPNEMAIILRRDRLAYGRLGLMNPDADIADAISSFIFQHLFPTESINSVEKPDPKRQGNGGRYCELPGLPICTGEGPSPIWVSVNARIHALCHLLAGLAASRDTTRRAAFRLLAFPDRVVARKSTNRIHVPRTPDHPSDLESLINKYAHVIPHLERQRVDIEQASSLAAVQVFNIEFPFLKIEPLKENLQIVPYRWLATSYNKAFVCTGEGSTPMEAFSAVLWHNLFLQVDKDLPKPIRPATSSHKPIHHFTRATKIVTQPIAAAPTAALNADNLPPPLTPHAKTKEPQSRSSSRTRTEAEKADLRAHRTPPHKRGESREPLISVPEKSIDSVSAAKKLANPTPMPSSAGSVRHGAHSERPNRAVVEVRVIELPGGDVLSNREWYDSLAPGPAVDCQTPASVLDTEPHLFTAKILATLNQSDAQVLIKRLGRTKPDPVIESILCNEPSLEASAIRAFLELQDFASVLVSDFIAEHPFFHVWRADPFAALRLHMLKTYGQWLGEAGECTKYTKLDIPLESARFRPTLTLFFARVFVADKLQADGVGTSKQMALRTAVAYALLKWDKSMS